MNSLIGECWVEAKKESQKKVAKSLLFHIIYYYFCSLNHNGPF